MFNCGNGKFWFQGSVSPAKTGSRVWYTGQFRFQGQCWNWLQDVTAAQAGMLRLVEELTARQLQLEHFDALDIFRLYEQDVWAKLWSSGEQPAWEAGDMALWREYSSWAAQRWCEHEQNRAANREMLSSENSTGSRSFRGCSLLEHSAEGHCCWVPGPAGQA